jgi:predicted secreted protein
MNTANIAANGLSVEEFRESANQIVAEVGKVIVGQQEVLRHVLIGVKASPVSAKPR